MLFLKKKNKKKLAKYLTVKSEEIGHEIVVLEDSPYEQIYFSLSPPASFIKEYSNTIYFNSFSKSHSLAGERIGYIAVHPQIGTSEERPVLMKILTSMLRFRVINAPALMQRVITRLGCEICIDVEAIKKRVRTLEYALKENGFNLNPAKGAFYIFAEIPKIFPDLETWNKIAMEGEEPLLGVPGSIFGGERYKRFIRFGLTVSEAEVERAVRRIHEICQSTNKRMGFAHVTIG